MVGESNALAQQRMTLNGHFMHRTLSALAELLVFYRASTCEGGLGSRNAVSHAVCHTHGL